MQKTFNVKSVEESWAVAAEVAELLKPGMVMALHGELGAGKTTFMQGIAMALGLNRPVTSPTFTLSNEYNAPAFKLVHMDLYRLTSPDDLPAIGYSEHIESGAVVAVEWPERAEELIPPDAIHIYLELGDEMEDRVIRIQIQETIIAENQCRASPATQLHFARPFAPRKNHALHYWAVL